MQPSVEGVNGESVVSSRGCIRPHRLHPTPLLSTSKGPKIPSSDKWLARRKAERQKGQISCWKLPWNQKQRRQGGQATHNHLQALPQEILMMELNYEYRLSFPLFQNCFLSLLLGMI